MPNLKPTEEQKSVYILGVLKGLGLAPTLNRLTFFKAWIAAENIDAKSNNYLATTWNLYPSRALLNGKKYTAQNWNTNPYFHNWNGGQPVKNYDNINDGILAMVNTLKYGGYYPRINDGLKKDLPPAEILKTIGTELEVYGTTKKLVSDTLANIQKIPTPIKKK